MNKSYYEIMMSARKLFNNVFQAPQKIIDKIGMYRVVTLSLLILFAISMVASITGFLYYSAFALISSLVIALGVALIINIVCARLWRVHANHESAVITALILFFMMIPSATLAENWQLAAGVALAMVSKYILAWRRQHILNPAAIGAVALALIVTAINSIQGTDYNTDIFSWWVANPILLWPVWLFGLLITSKVRRMAMVLAFLCVGLGVFVFESLQYDPSIWSSAKLYFVSYPTLFLGLFMLTEPFTMPPRRYQQVLYGGLVGALAATNVFASWFAMTPELALVLGNVFAYSFRLKQKTFLTLKSKREVAKNTWEFCFAKPKGFHFLPGQYAEWMLPHAKSDNRGIRRYFTIVSSPTEADIRLAFRVVPPNASQAGSTFKKAFLTLDKDAEVVLSQVAGDFLLPKVPSKVGFIAGGIGITPFVSHLQWMHDSNQNYDASLYYCVNTSDELAYYEEFLALAKKIDMKLIPTISQEDVSAPYQKAYVTEALLAQHTPDFIDRTWYLSGPPAMVNSYKDLLVTIGVAPSKIKTDYFPGLA